MDTQPFTEMKKQAEAKLAAKQNAGGVDAGAIKAWENSLAGNPPLFFTNTTARNTVAVAVAAYQELAAKQEKTASRLAAATAAARESSTAAPVTAATKPGTTATPAKATAKVKTRDEFNAMSHSDRDEFFRNGGKLTA